MNCWKLEKDNMKPDINKIIKIQAQIKEELNKVILDIGTIVKLKEWYKWLEELRGETMPRKTKKVKK